MPWSTFGLEISPLLNSNPINTFSSCKDRSFSQRSNKNRSDPYDFSLGITLYVKLFAAHQEGVRLLKRNRLGFETASKFSKHLSSNLYVNRIKIINRFFSLADVTSAAYTIFSAKRCLKAPKSKRERGTNAKQKMVWKEGGNKAQIKLALNNTKTTTLLLRVAKSEESQRPLKSSVNFVECKLDDKQKMENNIRREGEF